MPTSDDEQHAMQPRCVSCLGEQFGPAVARFSAGIVPCGRCGQPTKPMTPGAYRAALAAARARVAAKVAAKVARRSHAHALDGKGRDGV